MRLPDGLRSKTASLFPGNQHPTKMSSNKQKNEVPARNQICVRFIAYIESNSPKLEPITKHWVAEITLRVNRA